MYLEQSIKERFEEASKNAEIIRAAEKLIKCKGRYHAELNYKALAELFGVTVPTVESESESKWIKCSELMPVPEYKQDQYIVSTDDGLVMAAWYSKEESIFKDEHNGVWVPNVTHWMPLPPPPTE